MNLCFWCLSKCFNNGKTFLRCLTLFWGLLRGFCTVTVHCKKPISTIVKWKSNLKESFFLPGCPNCGTRNWTLVQEVVLDLGWAQTLHKDVFLGNHRWGFEAKKDAELRLFCANAVTTELLRCYRLSQYCLIAQWWLLCTLRGWHCWGSIPRICSGGMFCLRIPFGTGCTLSCLVLPPYLQLLAQGQ